MNAIVRVLLSPWQARRNRGQMWLLPALIAAGAMPLIVLTALSPSDRLSRVATVVAPTMLVFGLAVIWAVAVFDVLRQNQPQLARLVPAHVRILRRALWTGAALCSVLVAAVGALAGVGFLPVLTTAVVLCAAIGIAVRWPLAALVPAVTAFSPGLAADRLVPIVMAAWEARPAALMLAAVAFAGLALHVVVLPGGRYHRKVHGRLDVFVAAAREHAAAKSGRSPGVFLWGWQQALMQGPYSALLRRSVERPHGGVGARLALGMGPQAHWSFLIVSLPFTIAFVAAAALARIGFPGWSMGHGLLGGSLIGMALSALMVPLQMAAAMSRTRREQSLLLLLPASLHGASLNRWLALRFACFQIAVIAIVTGVLVLVGAVVPRSDEALEIPDIALSAIALSPLALLVLWRDWSRLGDGLGAWQVATFSAATVMGVAAFFWVRSGHGWPSLLGVTALVLLAVGPWRWRHAVRAPSAWPAGRF